MKKLYTIFAFAFLIAQGEKSFSQSAFQFWAPDTVAHGDTMAYGDIECHGSFIRNKTANTINIYVVREQNLNLASGWLSYFCTDLQCFSDIVDSVPVNIAAYDSTEFIPHFGITATPDSHSILMKIRNLNNPSDIAYQRFYGVTKIGYVGIHEYANLATVSIYPSPVVAGNGFTINITNAKSQSKNISIVVYNIYGSIVGTVNGLTEGRNTLNFDLASGLYSYNLIAGEVSINSGKFSVIK